jgi:hypothetical protein
MLRFNIGAGGRALRNAESKLAAKQLTYSRRYHQHWGRVYAAQAQSGLNSQISTKKRPCVVAEPFESGNPARFYFDW